LEPEEFFDVPGLFSFKFLLVFILFSLLELAQNPLVKRVISIFDKNKDGKISFTEFLSGLGALYGGFLGKLQFF